MFVDDLELFIVVGCIVEEEGRGPPDPALGLTSVISFVPSVLFCAIFVVPFGASGFGVGGG